MRLQTVLPLQEWTIFAYTLFMRIVLQRVSGARVTVNGEETGSIGQGYVLLVGIMQRDTEAEAAWLARKISALRLFDGVDGTINDRSIIDVAGGVLVVSQFTLAADLRKGNRPDYTAAAMPGEAQALYELFVSRLHDAGITQVATGRFGAHMMVEIVNNGPVTLILDQSADAA